MAGTHIVSHNSLLVTGGSKAINLQSYYFKRKDWDKSIQLQQYLQNSMYGADLPSLWLPEKMNSQRLQHFQAAFFADFFFLPSLWDQKP